GVGEHVFVAVCRRVDEGYGLAGVDCAPVKRDGLRNGAGEAAVGGVETHKLLDSRRNQLGVLAKLLLKLRVAGEVDADAAEEDGRSNHSDDKRLPQRPNNKILSEGLALVGLAEQRARRVFFWVARVDLAVGD